MRRDIVPRFDERGLVPVIIQDAEDGEVLMLAYMNKEAWELTLKTGEVWFYSRSRKTLWHKGETSGNRLIVREIRIDCDEDAVLIKVKPLGPVCHTGERSCFFREIHQGK